MIILQDLQSDLLNKNLPWEAADNYLTELPRERQLIRLGVPIERITTEVTTSEDLDVADIPAAIDYRRLGGKNFVTSIKDQSDCGSCVAFGAVATVETTYARAINSHNPRIDLSEAHLFFCYAEGEGESCESGWWPSRAYHHIRTTGVSDEACYPYRLPSDHCSGRCADWGSRLTKIATASRLSTGAQIKDWLANQGPVSACFDVYDDFFYYSSGIYSHATGSLAGGHCICIIGYDDVANCWICKNSWGSGWGELGFFRIAYGQCRIESWETHGVAGVTVPNSISAH
jgi:C1A family cysteine protease